MAFSETIKKYIRKKNILTIILFLVLTALYFFIIYKIFKPNILTWWSDEYEYVSEARNFALFSKLETSFYSAKAALSSNFPSFGYHPILFSFLMGLFLKIFKGNPNATFTFNYFLFFLTLITMFFYSKQRTAQKDSIYPIILLALFPVVLIYLNTQATEIFFILLVPLIYFVFYKNQFKFNLNHFIMLLLLSIISCQRFTYLIMAVAILSYIYFNWLKNKKIFYFFPSLVFFIGSYILLYYIFSSNTQLYPAGEKTHILQYIKYYGISTLTNKESWVFFYQHIIDNLKNFFKIFIDISSTYFLFHWLFFGIIFLNIFLLFKTKDIILKKELSLILILQCILTVASITSYTTTDLSNFTHLRPIFGFLPLNLYYIFIFIKKLKIKIRTVFLIFFTVIFILSSFYVYKPFYLKKLEASSNQNINNIKSITSAMEKYSYKKNLVISGIDDTEMPIRDYIVYSNNGDKFIRINQFSLNEYEINKFIEKVNTDIWLIKDNQYFIKYRLNRWPFGFNIHKNNNLENNSVWKLFVKEDAFPKEAIYKTNIGTFKEEWRPMNNCEFIIGKDKIIVNATGDNPWFENAHIFNFKDNLNYYLKIKLISSEPSHLQLYYRKEGECDIYIEEASSKFLTHKGENTVITKIEGNMIRIDPGTNKGTYILKEIAIYSSKF